MTTGARSSTRRHITAACSRYITSVQKIPKQAPQPASPGGVPLNLTYVSQNLNCGIDNVDGAVFGFHVNGWQFPKAKVRRCRRLLAPANRIQVQEGRSLRRCEIALVMHTLASRARRSVRSVGDGAASLIVIDGLSEGLQAEMRSCREIEPELSNNELPVPHRLD